MSTWEERMAARHVEREHGKALAAHPEESAAADQLNATQARWETFVEANGGSWPWVRGEPHHGRPYRFDHWHPAHGNATVDAATGDILNVFTVVIDADAPPRPDVCPVCRDFKREEWT